MSRLVPRDIERIDLGDGDWADLRLRLSYGDRAALEEKLLGPRIRGEGTVSIDAIDRGMNLRDANIELLVRSIVAWGGPGFCTAAEHPHVGDCKPHPITRETIGELDETAERILTIVMKRTRPRQTPDFTKPLSPDTSTGGAEVPAPDDAPPSSPSVAATAGASAT